MFPAIQVSPYPYLPPQVCPSNALESKPTVCWKSVQPNPFFRCVVCPAGGQDSSCRCVCLLLFCPVL